MKILLLLLLLPVTLLTACGPSGSDQVLVSDLPDPAIYGLSLTELPEVGLGWQQSYNQTKTYETYKWSYLAYQAYQPGSMGVTLASAFAVNNDIVLYSVDMSREDLPQPPEALGNIQGISWKSASLAHRLGDKSQVWKTNLGDLMTPVWWLEFYQGHAYVRISLLGFPDQLAPSLLEKLGSTIAGRLPRSVVTLRSDAKTVMATQPGITPTSIGPFTTSTSPATSETPPPTSLSYLNILNYTAPPGETGAVSFIDDTGNQLVDGILGSNDILADLGHGAGYEWVGWTDQTEPVTLTFSIEPNANLAAILIGLNHRDGLGVFVPASVMINGTRFELQADAVPNNQRADLNFNGPFQGPKVEIVLHHRGRGWILVDEVRFIASP